MEGAVLPRQQQRADALGPHGFHLVGHAGHQHSAMALLLKPGTGGGAVVVDDLMPFGGHHGLLAVVGGRLPTGAGKKAGDLLPLGFVKGQLVPKTGSHRLLGQVVCRGAQAAGEDQKITAALGLVDEIRQTAMVVANGALPLDGDAQVGQLPAQVLGVGVEDIAEQQLGAHTDDLCRHRLTPQNPRRR